VTASGIVVVPGQRRLSAHLPTAAQERQAGAGTEKRPPAHAGGFQVVLAPSRLGCRRETSPGSRQELPQAAKAKRYE
jgi:hypothetical protein